MGNIKVIVIGLLLVFLAMLMYPDERQALVATFDQPSPSQQTYRDHINQATPVGYTVPVNNPRYIDPAIRCSRIDWQYLFSIYDQGITTHTIPTLDRARLDASARQLYSLTGQQTGVGTFIPDTNEFTLVRNNLSPIQIGTYLTTYHDILLDAYALCP